MKTKDYKQHAWARWLYSLCLIIVLTAVPHSMMGNALQDMIVITENVGLGTPVIKVKIPMAEIYGTDADGMARYDQACVMQDFELYLKTKAGKVVVAKMSELGISPMTFPTSSSAWMMKMLTVPDSWKSKHEAYWGVSSRLETIPTVFGTQQGALHTQAYSKTVDGSLIDYYIEFDIMPERYYIDSDDYLVVGYEGTSKRDSGTTVSESNEAAIYSNIDYSNLGFVRGNQSIAYKGSIAAYENFKHTMDLYESDPTSSSFNPKTNEPIYTSNITDYGATSINFTFDGLTVDNSKSVTLYPVIRHINKLQSNQIDSDYGNWVAYSQQYLHYLDAVTLPGYAYAKNVDVEYADEYKKWMKVTWESGGEGDNYNRDGKWYIYRQEYGVENADIECLGNTAYDKLEFRDEDKNGHLEYGKKYTYTICFIPTGWDSDTYKNAEGLYSQKTVTLERTFKFGTTTGEEPEMYTTTIKDKNEIVLHWAISAIGDANTNPYKMYVDRTTTPDDALSWTELGSIDVNSTTLTSGTYTDRNGLELYEAYYYRLRINVQNYDFVSPYVIGSLEGGSEITRVTASRGTYTSVVKLQWEVKQVGSSKSYFVLSRRPLGSTDDEDYADIYTTSGTDDIYSYDDGTARSGSYYEYRVRIYALHKGEQKGAMSMSTDGYCIQTGVLSGRIYYGTGTAVEGVKVLLKPNDGDGEILNKFRSIDLTEDGSSITYEPGYEKMSGLLSKDFTMQMYVNPAAASVAGEEQSLITIPGALYVTLKSTTVDGKQRFEVCYRTSESGASTGLGVYVKEDEWSSLSLAYNKASQELKAYVVSYKDGSAEPEFRTSTLTDNVTIAVTEPDESGENGTQAIKIGDAFGSANQYNGLVDEFRFWTKTLSQTDVEKNYFHTLSGSESKLAIYWPMDEGMQNQVVTYDLSQTNDAANECHAVVTNASSSENIPDEEMLSLCSLTDGEGNYVLRGVPFSGTGTNYVVTPIFGIHEFSPSSASCYLSGQSTVHSGIDFTDASSFPVSGLVLYEGTTIPVEGAQLMVDGALSAKDGKAIATDANGEFTVDVPIGDHFISLSLNGHTFVSEGRYPEDPDGVGARHTFESAVSGLKFYDNTKVVVAGRVAGGDIENEKPLGVGAGKANLGQGKINLAFNGSDRYYINSKQVQNGLSISYDINDQQRDFATGADSIKSNAYVAGGKNVITIETDPETGEWSALLPPLKYSTESITIPSQPELDFSNNLGVIDASNAIVVLTDSIESDQPELDGYARFKYCAAYKVEYRSPSHFDVIQNEDGSYGDEEYEVATLSGKTDTIKLYTVAEDGKVNYTFGHPIFTQSQKYTFKIKAYEQYVNNDGEEPVADNVPLGNLKVTAKNQMASSTAVVLATGEVHDVEDDEFELDSLGCAVYQFNAGLPNLQEPYTRTLAFSYNIDGTELAWDGNSTFKSVVIGMLPKGNDFITEGPDKPLMILRDPPGSASTATFTKGSVVAKSSTYSNSIAGGAGTTATTKFGAKLAVVTMAGLVGQITEAESKLELEGGVELTYTHEHSNATTTTTTITTDISTSDSPDFVGAKGDIYIGASTNIVLGACQDLSIVKNEVSGEYEFKVADMTMSSEEFTTSFNYTQDYIETKLIPNMLTQRDNLLQCVSDVNSVARPKKGKDPIYVTTLSPEDSKFGTSNSDKNVWGSAAVSFGGANLFEAGRWDGPSYSVILPEECEDFTDKVQYYNSQVLNWQNIIARNEKDKVNAIEKRTLLKNYSFDGGSTITYSNTIDKDTTEVNSNAFGMNVASSQKFSTDICGQGVDFQVQEKEESSNKWEKGEQHVHTSGFSFTLADDSNNDYLSVDVLEDKTDAFSPIFYTRAGATSGPYEDEVVTKYYKPGTVIQQKTLQVEKPELEILDPIVTGVPAGKDATFRIVMHNNSETKANIYYGIRVVASSNPDGAQIFMDGKNITEGAQILVMGGESVTKTLMLRQTNQDILDYKDIILHMYAITQPDDVFSDQTVSVSFQPTCTDIDLAATTSVVNTDSDVPVTFSMSGYDYNQSSFSEIRLQYKGENDANFKNLQVFVKDADKAASDPTLKVFKALTGTEKLTHMVDLRASDYTDQAYIFRAQTVGYRGGSEVTNESKEIRIVRDMSRPQLITNPTPANGVLTAGGNITLTFNEDISQNILTKTGNFVVTGSMNETEVAHEVAMDLTGTSAAKTTATIDLSDRPFSANLWINYTADGTILQHGTTGNNFTASIREGKLVLAVGDDEVVSTNTLPTGKWLFLAFNYDNSGEKPVVSASYAQDADVVSLFESREIAQYEGNGPLAVGGNGMKAHMQELTLWNSARSISEALADRSTTKNPYTSGLIGYWQLSEGHGVVASDRARSRDLTLPAENAWFINGGENYAVKLDGATVVEAPVSTTAGEDDSYMVELWFNIPEKGSSNQTIVSLGKFMDVNVNTAGQVVTTVGGTSATAYATNVCDGQWHHLALNVLKGSNGSASLFIDGLARKQFAASTMPGLGAAAHIVLGARQQMNGEDPVYDQHMTGSIDELRVWNGRRTADVVKSTMYQRVADDAEGLEAYYPMEVRSLDTYGQIVTTSTAKEMKAGNKSGLSMTANSTLKFDTDAPALASAPALENVQFDYVASERQITINLGEEPYKIENCNVNLTVKNVKDLNGNSSQPITWTIFVQQNQMKWVEDEINIETTNGQSETFAAEIENAGATSDSWTLKGIPSWLTVNAESGNLAPQGSQKLRFTVDPSTSVGTYEATIYLTGSQNIDAPLNITLKVKGDEPDWNPMPDEETMNIVAQINVDGIVCSDPDDMLAAFRGQECVGVAKPTYSSRYDAYFLMLNIYGNSETEDAALTYKFYDASTGIIYPSVTSSNDKVFTYKSNVLIGSFQDWVVFNPENKIEQDLSLDRTGWKWFSMYVTPTDQTIESIFTDATGKIEVVKSSSETTMYKDDKWAGSLSELGLTTMYKLRASEAYEETSIGVPADPSKVDITIEPETWTWIGYPVSATNSVTAAFADADPQDGDIVKSQNAFATYDGGDWAGSLTSMTPGEGYKYYSAASSQKTFNFQAPADNGRKRFAARPQANILCLTSEDNMSVIADVMLNGEPIEGSTISVYAGDELCGYSAPDSETGLHFITVGSTDNGSRKLRFVVETEDDTYVFDALFDFRADAVIGSVKNPFMLNLDMATGIGSQYAGKAIDRIEYYDLTGRLISAEETSASAKNVKEVSGKQVALKRVVYADGTSRVFKTIE